MIPEIGHFALVLALAASVMLAILPLFGALRRDPRLMATARPLAYMQFFFLSISLFCLILAFVYNDFSVAYVASNSNSRLPLGFRISAVWGGHEGSLLLWVWILGGWTLAVAVFSRSLPRELLSRVLGVLGIIAIGFVSFTEFTSNPFDRLLPGFPIDGQDLNPLLQDIGLIIHPPMLYMGYVGFSVAFAFVVGALLSGQLDSAWARWSRPWTTLAWCFLTLGIALGSWWAYYELGWGGWWFWDPVENASFMPWLAGTALLHSLAATEKRGVFRAWTVLLAIASFSLSLLGTFLVRSGVLTSVHAFASDPARGAYILALLTVITGSALLLLVMRAHLIRSEGRYSMVSRESFLLINNVLLVGACLVVFVGTLFPLLVDVLELGKISVGPPYFNALFVPLTFTLMAALGVGPLLRWKGERPSAVARESLPWFVLSVAIGLALALLVAPSFDYLVALSLILVCWVVAAEVRDLLSRSRGRQRPLFTLWHTPRHYKGMLLGHLGLAITVTGVAITSAYSVERDVRMTVGDTVQAGPYEFFLRSLVPAPGPNYDSTLATIEVREAGAKQSSPPVTVLYPEKRQYFIQQTTMTEVALYPHLTQDLYVALGEPLAENSWAVRVHYKPFVRWLWGGALVMALGGLVALSDRRYKFAKKRATGLEGQSDAAPQQA